MYERKVRFKDFNGNDHVETLYFHLFGPDIAELGFDPVFRFKFKRGFGAYIDEIGRSGGQAKIFALYKLLVVSSYGRRSEDGDRIFKKTEFTTDFLSSQPYEEFIAWLLNDTKNAEEFWNGIVPEWLAKRFVSTNRQLLDLSTDELEQRTRNKLAVTSA